jgi:hypothetical protein
MFHNVCFKDFLKLLSLKQIWVNQKLFLDQLEYDNTSKLHYIMLVFGSVQMPSNCQAEPVCLNICSPSLELVGVVNA